jgi:hypothetical protein
MLELFEINCDVWHGTALRIRESLGLIAVITFYVQVSLFFVIYVSNLHVLKGFISM